MGLRCPDCLGLRHARFGCHGMSRLHLGRPPVTAFDDGRVRVRRQRICLLHGMIEPCAYVSTHQVAS